MLLTKVFFQLGTGMSLQTVFRSSLTLQTSYPRLGELHGDNFNRKQATTLSLLR